MANKKIWAYAIDCNGHYVVGEKHPMRIFYIWEALRMRDQRIHEFRKLTFMSTQRDPSKRQDVVPVVNGFFRYNSGKGVTDHYDKDGSSLSHSIAIQVIAEMDVIPFVIGDKSIPLKVTDIRTDDLKIQLTNRDKFEYYYPDLICQFSEPAELALKWGGKVAIEVKHYHACEPEKCQDFENHGIPIIEVNIENICIEKWYNTKTPLPEQLEQYYSRLKKMLQEKIYGRILSDPVSTVYHKAVLRREKDRTEGIVESLEKVREIVREISERRDILQKEREALIVKNRELESSIEQKEAEMLSMDKRGLGYYLLKLLRFAP